MLAGGALIKRHGGPNSGQCCELQVRALLDTQHGNPQMLPFYCRVAATLSQVFPDIREAVVKAQKQEFLRLRVRL